MAHIRATSTPISIELVSVEVGIRLIPEILTHDDHLSNNRRIYVEPPSGDTSEFTFQIVSQPEKPRRCTTYTLKINLIEIL